MASDAVLHRLVFELRYNDGFVYLDRCGQTLNSLLREFPEWECAKADPSSGQLVHRKTNRSFTFGTAKLDLAQTQSPDVVTIGPPQEFGNLCDGLATIVTEELGLCSFSRIGVRAWHLLGAKTREEADNAILGLGFLNQDRMVSAVGGKPTAGSFSLTLEREHAFWRVAVTSVEQDVFTDPTALRRLARSRPRDQDRGQDRALRDKIRAERALKHVPPVAVLVDIDAYMEDPPIPQDLSIREFVANEVDAMRTAAEAIAQQRG